MKYKVEDLTGDKLDAAVALILGMSRPHTSEMPDWFPRVNPDDDHFGDPFEPSIKFEHGAAIIEHECIVCWPASRYIDPPNPKDPDIEVKGWNAMHPDSRGLGGWHILGAIDVGPHDGMFGSTMLVAGMRALVQAKFGDEVELP